MFFKDGNTPYSLALNGGNKDLADFVMEYASTMPQKHDSGPSQMTIFDMKVMQHNNGIESCSYDRIG